MARAPLGLKALIPELDVLAASPYKRAFETAEIIGNAYGDLTVERVAELTPGASVDRVVAWLTGRHARGSVAVVGHEPDLSRLVCTLLADTSRPFLELRKGAACLLEFPGPVGRGAATLDWFLGPKHLRLLDAATAARERLPDASDAEALHDFRVAMRRLRSTLRAYQPQLEAVVPAKLRRRLRDLARATGEARDVEVQISWLERQRDELPAARRAGVPWLLSGLTQRRERAYQDIRERIAPKFERLARRLRRALGSVPPPDATVPASLASLIAQLLEDQGSDRERRLALIRSPANHAEAHAARIRVKRARYLLEPVVREAKPAAAVVRRLKHVQQLLGDLHDLQVVIVRLGDAAAAAAAQRTRRLHELAVGGDRGIAARGPRPATSGLLALARVARATQERLFRRLVNRRLARSLPAELTALAAELRPLAAPAVTPVAGWPSRAPARPPRPLPARYTHRAGA